MLLVLLTTLLYLAKGVCEGNCQTCRDQFPGDYSCLACSSGFELVTTFNICYNEMSIANCALYDHTLNCLSCRPSYQQPLNLCIKVYNGCRQYDY